jgi:hypothetical protein
VRVYPVAVPGRDGHAAKPDGRGAGGPGHRARHAGADPGRVEQHRHHNRVGLDLPGRVGHEVAGLGAVLLGAGPDACRHDVDAGASANRDRAELLAEADLVAVDSAVESVGESAATAEPAESAGPAVLVLA